jgi:hypothetical protein
MVENIFLAVVPTNFIKYFVKNVFYFQVTCKLNFSQEFGSPDRVRKWLPYYRNGRERTNHIAS